ncbi:MAG: hypothetical protein WDA07_12985 [Leucobacter sp.]
MMIEAKVGAPYRIERSRGLIVIRRGSKAMFMDCDSATKIADALIDFVESAGE